MQRIDPDDKRPKYVQIAAAVRAAVLTGELLPGWQLPSIEDLATEFGVAQMTVRQALKALEEEGYLRALGGSGVYVRDQATLPVPDGEDHPLTGVARFLYEMGQLKNQPRSGWLLLGITQPESVADHSFRVAMVGVMLAAIDGADVGRTAALAVFHDGHETRIGDVPSVGRAYVTTAAPEAVTSQQAAGMPERAAEALQSLTAEYEAAVTRESQLAHDADKIETLLQACEYESRGYKTEGWKETSLAALRTETGQQLAQAISVTGVLDWIQPFQASYHELRKITRAHRDE